MKYTAKEIQHRLIEHIDRPDLIWLPNAHWAGGECDLLSISFHNYLTEYEIKVSSSDWYADKGKKKWQHKDRDTIAYFNYCIPLPLYAKIPSFVPETAGIITFDKREWGILVEEQRPAKKNPDARKIELKEKVDILKKSWYRYRLSIVEEIQNAKLLHSSFSTGGG